VQDRNSNSNKHARLIAGVFAIGLFAFLVYAMHSGEIPVKGGYRISRSSNPALFWLSIVISAAGAIGCALVALGVVYPGITREGVAEYRERKALNADVLLLLASAFFAAQWVSAWLGGHQDPQELNFVGSLALIFFGWALWSRWVPSGRLRHAARVAGVALVLLGAATLYRVMTEAPKIEPVRSKPLELILPAPSTGR
jgi:hypothetical protein